MRKNTYMGYASEDEYDKAIDAWARQDVGEAEDADLELISFIQEDIKQAQSFLGDAFQEIYAELQKDYPEKFKRSLAASNSQGSR